MDEKVSTEAVKFIKSHRKDLIERFAGDVLYSQEKNPVSIFMAGSPGAGKTEFSRRFLKVNKLNMVRIDADDVKEFIPQYDKKNSSDVQGASSLGVEKLYDYVLKAKKSDILDGTFAYYEKVKSNIERSLKYGRYVSIFYVYQNPLVAWKFTKAREALEGRNVPKDVFVDALFQAKENVNKIKLEFGKNVHLNVIIKNFESSTEETHLEVGNVDQYVTINYSKEVLLDSLSI
ncbi:MAG: zeta toxin family protein [Patescibacteria group bacterium]